MKNGDKLELIQYQGLFNYFVENHSLLLTIGEMEDIISAVEKHKNSL